MNACRKLIVTHKSISWLLVVAVIYITLLPVHYHLHHMAIDDIHSVDAINHSHVAINHSHVIDLHLMTDKSGQLHHDDEATSIAASPDGIVKKTNPAFSPFILLAIVLVLFPVLIKRLKIWLDYRSIGFNKSYPHFLPLLRAPPLH